MAEQRVQRRLAAILAADVVGYSRLMEADEAGTLGQLRALRRELLDPSLQEHHGRIFKTAGDGILIEFSSAVDAVEDAVSVQQAMARRNIGVPEDRRIQLRVGINLGDVIADDGDVFGDGVNVAARLEGLAEPGGICISGAVFDQIGNKTGYSFVDIGRQTVKNISRPIQVYRVVFDDTNAEAGPRSSDPSNVETILSRPAIAVLPFENLSGDPAQDYFADGLTEDLTSVLSAWRSFPVIARNSTFTYKGRAVKVQQVAEELGARYVMEGSVRTAGKRMRVVAQLIDAETGHHIWAERYDREIEDIFDLQDEITNAIANIIEPELNRVESRRVATRQPMSLDAWESYQRGMALLEDFSKESTELARAMFQRAIEIDASYAQAYSGLAYSHHRDLFLGFSDEPERSREKFGQAIRRAAALDDSDAFSHWIMSLYHRGALEPEKAVVEAERAIQRNPSLSLAHVTLGMALTFSGKPDEGILSLQRGLQLNPRDPRTFIFYGHLADAHLMASRYDEAIEWARRSAVAKPDYVAAQVLLAASLGFAGRVDEARTALDECFRLDPDFLDKPHGWKHYRRPENLEHILEGLRKAGLPRT